MLTSAADICCTCTACDILFHTEVLIFVPFHVLVGDSVPFRGIVEALYGRFIELLVDFSSETSSLKACI